MNSFSRPTWIEIELDRVADNVTKFIRQLPQASTVMAVVKANGYGHGSVQIAKAAIAAGAGALGVAFVDEAVALRRAGVDAPILVLGFTPEEGFEKAADYDLTITIGDASIADRLDRYVHIYKKKVKIHLKFDTGMGRLGFTSAESIVACLQKLADNPWVKVEGLFSHLACADDANTAHAEAQIQHFAAVVTKLEALQLRPPVVHLLNSAGAIRFPGHGYDMSRIGIGMYGLYPSDEMKQYPFTLSPALSFKTSIVQLKQVSAGATISYGATFKAPRPMAVATLPVGYADGYSRLLSNRGEVIVRGQRVPIIGRICMDQMMVDVSAVANVQCGDEVVLYGRQGADEISVDEIAGMLQTINYEVTCALANRIPRVYLRGGEVVEVSNDLL